MLQTGKNDNAMILFLARYLNDNFKQEAYIINFVCL